MCAAHRAVRETLLLIENGTVQAPVHAWRTAAYAVHIDRVTLCAAFRGIFAMPDRWRCQAPRYPGHFALPPRLLAEWAAL